MDVEPKTLLNDHEYFMGIAMAVRRRANCSGNRVGAIVVLEGRIVSTGYNGTPQSLENCMDGGCERCSNRAKYPSGTAYDLCICVHAEQNALLSAARFGIALAGGTVYSTMRPCFGCMKEMLQTKIERVYYVHDWVYPDPRMKKEYERVQGRFPGGLHSLGMADPEASWAVSRLREAVR
ncbi:MAG: dCMP deaminase family protein [Elusimicrobia bacterium]|nr:dCMP deaminase family protein [Elusimicrobiota bacterium]